jgi:hypothetical protein
MRLLDLGNGSVSVARRLMERHQCEYIVKFMHKYII